MNKIKISNNTIYYSDKGSGFPIIFLPGIDGDSTVWNNQTDDLSSMFRIISLDFSDIKLYNINIHDICQIINNFTEKLNISEFIIVGYSVGSLLSVSYANRYPDKIIGIITTSLNAYTHPIQKYILNYTEIKKEKSLLKFIFTFNFLKNYIKQKKYFRFANLLDNSLIINEFNNLSHPFLIINGQYDKLSNSYIKQIIKKNNIKFEIIQKSSKNCFYTHQIEYNNFLTEFINTLF